MTKLSTHIPIEYIKQSEKLFKVLRPTIGTIADIIDNAEELFENYKIWMVYFPEGMEAEFFSEEDLYKEYSRDEFTRPGAFRELIISRKHYEHQDRVLEMCQQNLDINTISSYILKNINEN